MSRPGPPYLGAAYYPEAWPPEQVDEDIHHLRDAGLNVVRIGEFAWSTIEPEEGRIELDWLVRVVEKLGAADIDAIMCTPSCAPPAWLTQKYPEVVVVNHAGVRAQHGSREHMCPNSPVYREFCGRIAARLGETFGRDERVIGWQIDNEVYLWQQWGCYCDLCRSKFHQWLKARFGTVDELNARWGTNLWSQTYQSFTQVPAPRADFWHHPSLQTAWITFQSESYVDYIGYQADVLHESVTQPVGTDMMPLMALSYEQTHRKLDVVQYNHYDTMDNLWRQVFWMDYVRPVKDRPFWNTETATCWNGGTTANGFKDPGFCRANSWLPIALGGEANLYWLWRTHWSGQELMHGAVVSSCGRPMHMIDEVREIAAGFDTTKDFLNGTRPAAPGLAMHLSTLAWTQFRFQSTVQGFDYVTSMIEYTYRALIDAHLRADIIEPAVSLDSYRMVYTPFLPALDEAGLRARLLPWIESGGTWVVGPLTDTRTLDATKPTHAPFVSLEDWAKVHCKYEIPADPSQLSLEWADGSMTKGGVWHSGFEARGADVLATYVSGPLKGLAAVTETRIGEGRIVLLGTHLPVETLQSFIVRLAAQCALHPAAEASANVLVVPRHGAAGKGAVIVEIHNRPGTLNLPAAGTDLLTGQTMAGTIEIDPYQVLVLKYAERRSPKERQVSNLEAFCDEAASEFAEKTGGPTGHS